MPISTLKNKLWYKSVYWSLLYKIHILQTTKGILLSAKQQNVGAGRPFVAIFFIDVPAFL